MKKSTHGKLARKIKKGYFFDFDEKYSQGVKPLRVVPFCTDEGTGDYEQGYLIVDAKGQTCRAIGIYVRGGRDV